MAKRIALALAGCLAASPCLAHTNCWGKRVTVDGCCGDADVYSSKDGSEFRPDSDGVHWYFRGHYVGHPPLPSDDGCWTVWYRRRGANGIFDAEQRDHDKLPWGSDSSDVNFYCIQIPLTN